MATAVVDDHGTIDPFDVSRPELYATDTWQEPFRQLRAEAPIHYVPDSKFGPYRSVSAYKPIVHIEALPKIFSSSWEYGGITLAMRRLRVNVLAEPTRVAACLVHGYKSLQVELERY